MRKILLTYTLLAIVAILSPAKMAAQQRPEETIVSFDSKIHDFGDVLESDGPLSHSFVFKNVCDRPLVIHNVVSSCGCTTPVWTKEPILPGKEGRIDVTFTNDQGPYPFDKSLTVYLSAPATRPVILRIRGQVHDRKKSIAELYCERIGKLGFRSKDTSLGYVDQGHSKSQEIKVANLSHGKMTVEALCSISGLSAVVSPNPIPEGKSATLTITLDTKKAAPKLWGRKDMSCSFIINGKKEEGSLSIAAVIKDDFSSMTSEQMARAAAPVIEKSYFEFGEIKAGKQIKAEYSIINKGREPLIIYAIDKKNKKVKVNTKLPLSIKAGGKGTIIASYDSSGEEGELLEVFTLTTNSPSKPLVNLFLTGNVIK